MEDNTTTPTCIIVPADLHKKIWYRITHNKPFYNKFEMKRLGLKIKRERKYDR